LAKEREVKHLRGKGIALVKVTWGGTSGGSITWELEIRMKNSYPELSTSGDFRGRKFFKLGRVVMPQKLHVNI